MFVQGWMQETDPKLHQYVGQDYHSHTTGTHSHRPERDWVSTDFPGIALKTSLNIVIGFSTTLQKCTITSVPMMFSRHKCCVYMVSMSIICGFWIIEITFKTQWKFAFKGWWGNQTSLFNSVAMLLFSVSVWHFLYCSVIISSNLFIKASQIHTCSLLKKLFFITYLYTSHFYLLAEYTFWQHGSVLV